MSSAGARRVPTAPVMSARPAGPTGSVARGKGSIGKVGGGSRRAASFGGGLAQDLEP